MEQLIAFAWLGFALFVGKVFRKWFPFLKNLFIPSAIIGGLFLLILGPEILGALTNNSIVLFPQESISLWSGMPGFLINIVFASLFLGKTLPSLQEVWQKAGPQVAFSHTVAWGQYVVGFGLTLFVLNPLFQVEPMFGALIEIGFIGGHGTAAGLGETFQELGWPQGQDLALGVATVGVIVGVLTGIVLVNWGVRKGHSVYLTSRTSSDAEIESAQKDLDSNEQELSIEVTADKTQEEKKSIILIESMEPMSFHLAYIAISIGVGAIILAGLTWIEAMTLAPLGVPVLLGHVPLFPLAMVGGIIVEKFHHTFFSGHLNRQLILKIQGTALDLLIVSALASLTLSALADAWLPLFLLILAGMLWTIGAFMFLAPRMMKDFWFERAIGDFGQSLGVTATGLLLIKIVDPKGSSPALEAFGYKQLLFEPLLGGGLFTAVSVPLVHAFGLPIMLGVTGVLLLFWIAVGLRLGSSKHRS
jgi:ESS family glutamate:Na+ symporter